MSKSKSKSTTMLNAKGMSTSMAIPMQMPVQIGNYSAKTKRENETKYHMLRTQLDKLNFIQPMDYKSLEMIEALLNELLLLRQRNETLTSIIEDSQERNEQQRLMLTAFKHQNADFFKQNGELHHEILTLLEKNSYQGKDFELKRLTDDTNTLKYLLNASKDKTLQYQTELSEMKQKYIELIVTIYEKKVNLSKLFEEIGESDQIILKERGIEMKPLSQGESELQSKQQNSSSQHTNSNNNNNNNRYSYAINNYNNRSNGDNQVLLSNKPSTRSTQELIEKIYRLETDLREKNNEIIMLKKALSTENALDQKVVIDYLRTELKMTKDKYESYLKFKVDKDNSSKHRYNNNGTYTSPNKDTQSKQKAQSLTDRKELVQINKLQKENKELKRMHQLIVNENNILKEDLKEMMRKYEHIEAKNIQYENEKDKDDLVIGTSANTEYANRDQRYKDNETKLISSLNERIKEINARLTSSQQHFKNKYHTYEKQIKELENAIAEMNKHLKFKEDLCMQQKEQINILNKKVLMLSNETISSS